MKRPDQSSAPSTLSPTSSASQASRPVADNEIRLVKKCRELNAEIVSNSAKVQTALRLSEEEQITINKLKDEVERAWKANDASKAKVGCTRGCGGCAQCCVTRMELVLRRKHS